MTEDRTEDPNVEPAPESQPHSGLFSRPIGEADARREEVVCGLNIQVKPDTLRSCDKHFARVDVHEAALSCPGHRLRTIILVAQPIINRQFARRAPVVLTVNEEAILPFFGVRDRADITLEAAHVAKQERSQRRAAAREPLCACGGEIQLARAMAI